MILCLYAYLINVVT